VSSPSSTDQPPEQVRRELIRLHNLQRRLLPQSPIPADGYLQSLVYRPSFVVTADYHDYFRRADGGTAVFVGDGSGNGPAASLLMAIMMTILRTHPDIHRLPGETLSRAGRMYHHLIPADRFMTGVYLALGGGGRVSWAAAGHHPPLRVNRRGEVYPTDLGPCGAILGVDPDEQYATVDWRLDVGDRLLVFTDGIWEGRDRYDEPFGLDRLRTHLTATVEVPLDEAVRSLVEDAQKHLEHSDFEDDYTVVGIERVE
jgi:phosphoserine phosphatase RsbU/P